ncbi:MAG TPA: DUF4399 domain-containing protein [Longimicrobiales bacterium]|nr:DUF4399 domain-containing protein [Longimicrobiales bacterium]
MHAQSFCRLPLLASLLLLQACGGDAPEPPAEPQAPAEAVAPAPPSDDQTATVTILDPAEGAEIQGPSVTVHLAATGIRIVPAGAVEPGTGHHHLYLDTDLGEPGVAIPKVDGAVIHLGTGVSEYTFENVAPGPHRLIAVVADGVHVPLMPWVVDTVNFVVR